MNVEDERLLRFAITHRRLIRFKLGGPHRIAEPHDYGIRNGVPQLLAYQVGGESRSGRLPNWRWILLELVTELEVLEETFAGGRGGSARNHSHWDELFLRVEEAKASDEQSERPHRNQGP
jgi:hypothetical protein